MIGKWTLRVDTRPHCLNGWGPTTKHPGCNYTGGHFCDRLADHAGRCRCTCGSASRRKPPPQPTAEEARELERFEAEE